MSNWRFIVILGMILIGIGIVPVSAYEETFTLSACEGATSETTVAYGGWKDVNAFYVSSGMIGVNWDGFNSYTPSGKIDNYASLGQSDNWRVTLHERQGVPGNPYAGIMGNATFGYFKYGPGDEGTHLCMYLDVHDIDKSRLSTDGYTTVMIKHQDGKTVPKLWQRGTTTSPRGYLDEMDTSHTGYLLSWGDYYASTSSPYNCYSIAGLETIHYYLLKSEWSNKIIVDEITTGFQRMDIQIIKDKGDIYGFSTSVVAFQDTALTKTDANNWNYTLLPDQYPVTVSIREIVTDTWYNRTFGIAPTPSPTPIPEPELTYPVTVNFRHQHDYSLVTDVYYLIGDLKPSPGYPYGKTLYSGWSDTGTINIELEHRSMDDPNFPQQYRIVGKKYGYYDGEIIVSHLTAPYTFNVIMEDSSVTPTVDTNFIEFRIQERFSDSYINDAILTIYDYESGVEVYNETVTGGIVTVRLNQTDTGYPYPHYKVNVYSEGYADFTEYILALYQDGIMRCRLTKVTTPLDPGNVILHVYTVRLDSNDNVVNVGNVRVTVGGIEKVTNSAGYTWFEVPKNSTQAYTAEHPQYAVMTGSVLVEEGERFLHIWMQPPDIGVTPTPTFVTPTPTPDYSTPTGPIDAVYNLFSMLGIPTLFIGFILTALIAIGCMIFAENFAEGTGLYAGILGVLIGAGMGLIPLWIVITFVFIGGIFYMKVIRGDG